MTTRSMDSLLASPYRRLAVALAVSLALHLAVLVLKASLSDNTAQPGANRPSSRVDVVLSKPRPAAKAVLPPPRAAVEPRRERLTKPAAEPTTRIAAVPEPAKTWSSAERQEMDQFLKELDAEAKPRSGQEMAHRAVDTARRMAAAADPEDDELKEMAQRLNRAKVEPFSLEMYLDALYRKMNRSAAMVKNEPRSKGAHVAAVRIVLAKDGTVKAFRVLWAADQQAEIDYIKAVVDQAAPFPAFPTDIRNATDAIVLQVCILPGRYADGSGATFTRMAKGQVCREPD